MKAISFPLKLELRGVGTQKERDGANERRRAMERKEARS